MDVTATHVTPAANKLDKFRIASSRFFARFFGAAFKVIRRACSGMSRQHTCCACSVRVPRFVVSSVCLASSYITHNNSSKLLGELVVVSAAVSLKCYLPVTSP